MKNDKNYKKQKLEIKCQGDGSNDNVILKR